MSCRNAQSRRRPARPSSAAVLPPRAALVFLALQSPIDPFAERAFWIHQVQHALLRMAGPMQLALSAPEGILVAGLPRWARRTMLRPLVCSRPMRGQSGVLENAFMVFAWFTGSLSIWQPVIQDAALLNPYLHYLMHVTILLARMSFFSRIFARSAAPKGLRHGVPLVMLIVTIMLSILLGSVTTLKTAVLYPAYDIGGRLFVESPRSDEQSGAHHLGVRPDGGADRHAGSHVRMGPPPMQRHQRHLAMSFSNSSALDLPETAEELWIKVDKPNRDLRLALLSIRVAVFLVVIGLAAFVPPHP